MSRRPAPTAQLALLVSGPNDAWELAHEVLDGVRLIVAATAAAGLKASGNESGCSELLRSTGTGLIKLSAQFLSSLKGP